MFNPSSPSKFPSDNYPKQGVFNHFPTPWPLSQGGGLELQEFGQNLASGGLEMQVFGREAPENGAEGAVLETFCNIECGKWLKSLKLL